MRFGYYNNLSSAKKAIYRKSDSIERIPLKNPAGIAELCLKLKTSLETRDRPAVARLSSRICRFVCDDLGTAPVTVKIKAQRPSDDEEELQGLYEWSEGEQAVITVWMKTAAKKQVVAFRSFVRTVFHELCHHIDYHYYALPESFHTEGFFKRESRLYRETVPRELQVIKKKPTKKKTPKKKRPPGNKPQQLEML